MKYAVITGASSGMGLEFARQLAERGYGISSSATGLTKTGRQQRQSVQYTTRMYG